jgi:undecaprenyl diphosphate synthase
MPQHVAIIMDGNRRWANSRGLPKTVGHGAGSRRVRAIVQACAERGISHLTLFAFSTENWRRPFDEVSSLIGLLTRYLQKEIGNLNARGVRLRVIGDTSGFDQRVQTLIRDAQASTDHNRGITLTLALNYGGRWDMLQAAQRMLRDRPELAAGFSEEDIAPYFCMSYAPEPDLFIRTGGEQRISNFLLWQCAYAELYFTHTLWPEFSAAAFDEALAWYAQRERRFGRTSQQVAANA